MTPKLVRTLWLPLCLSLALSSVGPDAWGLADEYKNSLKCQLKFIVAKNPKYLWGGADDLKKGLDCSGYVFLAAKWAGIPGITRTTSARMALGLGGWVGRDVDLREADDCDLVFWTFADEKINCHVGVFLGGIGRRQRVTHASFRKGVVLEPFEGPLFTSLSKIRRLSIGD